MNPIDHKGAAKVLVIDVGGTHVKVLATEEHEEREIPSGRTLTASKMVRDVKHSVRGWSYDVVSIGYPGPVIHGRPCTNPTILAAAGLASISARHLGVQ